MTYQQAAGSADRAHELPRVRSISPRDLWDALAKGFDDFWAMPTHVIFLCLIYPIVGVLIALCGVRLQPLAAAVYPMAAGFALLGPFVAIGLYELSRRREAGLDTDWSHAFDVLQARLAPRPSSRSASCCWRSSACGSRWRNAIYTANSATRRRQPRSTQFARQVLTTPAGHRMILIGNGVGFLFALVAFIDQRGGVPAADRPRDRRHRGGADLGARGAAQSGHHGAVGPDRRRAAVRRLAAVLPGARRS